MRIKDIEIGDRLVMGTPHALKDGSDPDKVTEVTVVAIGQYTSVRGPCGELQYASIEHGPAKVVVSASDWDLMTDYQRSCAENGSYNWDHTKIAAAKKQLQFFVHNGSHVMRTDEWETKRAPHIEMAEMVAKYQDESKEAYDAYAKVITDALAAEGLIGATAHVRERWRGKESPGRRYEIEVSFEEDQLRAFIGQEKFAEIVEAEKAYLKVAGKPPKCVTYPSFQHSMGHVVTTEK